MFTYAFAHVFVLRDDSQFSIECGVCSYFALCPFLSALTLLADLRYSSLFCCVLRYVFFVGIVCAIVLQARCRWNNCTVMAKSGKHRLGKRKSLNNQTVEQPNDTIASRQWMQCGCRKTNLSINFSVVCDFSLFILALLWNFCFKISVQVSYG